jgi:hypothetical protein
MIVKAWAPRIRSGPSSVVVSLDDVEQIEPFIQGTADAIRPK